MITEYDLQEVIAELNGKRNITPGECVNLAAYYIIQNQLFGSPAPDIPRDYFSAQSQADVLYDSGTEFSNAIQGKPIDDVFEILDELMTILKELNTSSGKLYRKVISELNNI